MPNWCNNKLTLKHSDPAQLERALRAFTEGGLLQEFIPCPQELRDAEATPKSFSNAEVKSDNLTKYGYESWYDWSVANWGTKWDIGTDDDMYSQDDIDVSSGELVLSFDSAWSPPVQGLANMEKHGFEVELLYNEPGMAFCGRYATGDGDRVYEYGRLNAAQAREVIPHKVNDEFDIIQQLLDYEENFKDGTAKDN
jgi:hypothetical protein